MVPVTLYVFRVFYKGIEHYCQSVTPNSINEIIFRTANRLIRIMLEVMAKGGMRIGEVLKIRPVDFKDRKIASPDPKRGRKSENLYAVCPSKAGIPRWGNAIIALPLNSESLML